MPLQTWGERGVWGERGTISLFISRNKQIHEYTRKICMSFCLWLACVPSINFYTWRNNFTESNKFYSWTDTLIVSGTSESFRSQSGSGIVRSFAFITFIVTGNTLACFYHHAYHIAIGKSSLQRHHQSTTAIANYYTVQTGFNVLLYFSVSYFYR